MTSCQRAAELVLRKLHHFKKLVSPYKSITLNKSVSLCKALSLCTLSSDRHPARGFSRPKADPSTVGASAPASRSTWCGIHCLLPNIYLSFIIYHVLFVMHGALFMVNGLWCMVSGWRFSNKKVGRLLALPLPHPEVPDFRVYCLLIMVVVYCSLWIMCHLSFTVYCF